MYAHAAGGTHLYCAKRKRNEISPGGSHCVTFAHCHIISKKTDYEISDVIIRKQKSKLCSI